MFDFIKENLINFNYPNYSRELSTKIDESELTDEWRRILDKVFNLYACKPKFEDFDIFGPNSVFEDPIVTATNKKEIEAQFMMMPLVLPKGVTNHFNILSLSDEELVLDMNHDFFTAVLYLPVNIRSRMSIRVKDGKVISIKDQWYYFNILKSKDGLVGFIWETARRMNGVTMPHIARLLVNLPK